MAHVIEKFWKLWKKEWEYYGKNIWEDILEEWYSVSKFKNCNHIKNIKFYSGLSLGL